MFYEYEDFGIENYSDDTRLYTCAPHSGTVVSKLQSTSDKLFTWFKNNHMKANLEKSHLLLSSKTPSESPFQESSIKSSTKETLLGALIDSKLRFDTHILLVCTSASRKINALDLITNFKTYEKRRLIVKAVIQSQFNYCPLI